MVSASVLSQSAGAWRARIVASLFSSMVSVSIALLLSIANAYPAEVPRGVFSLTPPNKPVNAAILGHPSVGGVSIRSQWQVVEPTEGVYNWSYFDSQITRVMNAGKTDPLLRISAGGQNTPQWVFDAGVQTFSFVDTIRYHDTYGQTLTIPVFWDPILEKEEKPYRRYGAAFFWQSRS